MHAVTVPYDIAQEHIEGERLEKVVNTIIFFTAINNSFYSHTDW